MHQKCKEAQVIHRSHDLIKKLKFLLRVTHFINKIDDKCVFLNKKIKIFLLRVAERSVSLLKLIVKFTENIRSENADMSNVKSGESPDRRKF